MMTGESAVLWTPKRKAVLAGLLALQFVAAYVIGTEHLLTNERHSVFAPIALIAILPVALFVATYALSAPFRSFVLSQDLRLLSQMQQWRVVGFAFLPLLAVGVLPGLFAWPAGLGDVAVGLAAIGVVARLNRDPAFVRSAAFVRFHLLGLLDFAVAITAAGLSAGAFPALIPGGVNSAAMDVWPLNLFPSFIVPAFVIVHLTVLLKVRHLRRAADASAGAMLPAT